MSSKSIPTDLATRLHQSCSNIWVEFNALAREFAEVNLGQGQPDYAPLEYVQRTLAEVVLEGNKYLQYTREQGHPRLVKAISTLYSPLFKRDIDPNTEILVTHGAYESLQSAFLGFVNPGDEVILIEPFYDSYAPMTRMAGGVPVFIPLRPHGQVTSSKDWRLDPKELRSKFSDRTKLFLLNTPNNPLGKVYDREELTMIANLCIEFNVICISDEVYEWLVYPGSEHVRIATLPGMWKRTVTICSASKAFSVTGWRVGWSIGPKSLIDCSMIAHQNGDCVCTTPAQEAIARCLETEAGRIDSPECLFTVQLNQLLKKRDRLADILRSLSLKPCVPQAGYFVLANWAEYNPSADVLGNKDDSDDFRFAKWLVKEKRVCGIPPSAFYGQNQSIATPFIRFCFFKTEEALDRAEVLLTA